MSNEAENGLIDLFNDAAQWQLLLPLVTEPGLQRGMWRALWRRTFFKEVPPWLDPKTVENPGPSATLGLLVGELCPICSRPLYLTKTENGIVCAGGHGEEQRRKAISGKKAKPESEDSIDEGFFD